MSTLKRGQAIALQTSRELCAANAGTWNHASLARSRSLTGAKRRRERILACLAFVMLIVAWDATLRLDEEMSPSRMRMSHAVEVDGELQAMTGVE